LSHFSFLLLQEFVLKMRTELYASYTKDPNASKVEAALPGVYQQFGALQQLVRQSMENSEVAVQTLRSEIKGIPKAIGRVVDCRVDSRVAGLRGVVGAVAGSLIEAGEAIRRADVETTTTAGVEPSVLDATVGDGDGDGDNNIATTTTICLPPCRQMVTSIRELMLEMKGLGSHVGIPIDGGYVGLESRDGAKWRKGMNAADSKWFSRAMLIVGAFDVDVERSGDGFDVVADRFDEWFTQSRRSLCSFVVRLQDDGLATKKASRKRKAAAVEAPLPS
jgi:hypothetical protein